MYGPFWFGTGSMLLPPRAPLGGVLDFRGGVLVLLLLHQLHRPQHQQGADLVERVHAAPLQPLGNGYPIEARKQYQKMRKFRSLSEGKFQTAFCQIHSLVEIQLS